MDTYFEEFKQRMKMMMRIPEELVTRYYNDICFLADTDNTFVQALKLRKAWLEGFDYEIYSDLLNANIVALLKEEIDTKAESFGKYEEAKAKITMNIKIASKEKKMKRMIEDLEEKLGTLGEGKEPLQITRGLGEDEENDSGDEEEEEEEGYKGKSLIVVTIPSKKDKRTKNKPVVTPLSPPPPTKPRTKATASAKQFVKERVVETNKPTASKPKRRRLVKGPPKRKISSIDEVCADLRRSSGLSNFRFVK